MDRSAKERQEKQRALRRLVIAQADLLQAAKFAQLILTQPEVVAEDEREALNRKDMATALSIAMVVAYSRPFLTSKTGRLNTSTPRLPDKIVRGLAPEQETLHRQLVQQRNQEFAHSDADAYSPQISNTAFGLIPIMRNPFPPPDIDRVAAIQELLHVLIHRVSDEIQKLRDSVEKGKTLYG